jgi:hypothetical protein
VATADYYSVDHDSTVTYTVLANDTDPDGDLDPATVTVVSPPTSGDATATANPDGTITYVGPGGGYHALDRFTYQVCDAAGACDTATVTLDVYHPENTGPPVAVDDSGSTSGGAPVLIDVAANDSDPEGKLKLDTVTVVDGPQHGTVSVHSNGTVTYTPDPVWTGVDTFVYLIRDDKKVSDFATVTVSST